MQEYTIDELRIEIINALENYEGEPVVLDLPNCLLKQVLFDTISDYLRFPNENSNFFKVLKKIDFSNVNFDGVYVGGQDLSQFKGISLNPQTINIKSLSGTKLNGVTITGSFDGVRVNYADFTGAKGMLEINPQEVYDKSLVSTVLNGVTITGSFDGVRVNYADFTGAKGMLEINPQEVYDKSLVSTVLNGVEFIGPFDGCDIRDADFTGSTRAVINPQLIKDKRLYATILNGVTITGSFDDVYINSVNFTGSVGAVINPQNICDGNMEKCKFADVFFDGYFDGCKISGADFTNSTGAKMNLNMVRERDSIRSIKFADVTFTDAIDGVGLYDCDFTGSKGACIVINEFVLGNSNLQSNNFKDAQIYGVMTDDIKEKLVNIEGATIVEMISESEKEERIKQYCLTKIKNLGKK